jgi:hypothetical protein
MRLVRLALGAAGVVAMGAGLLIGVREIPPDDWWPVARWLAGGLVVHDALVAPAAVVLGVVVLRRVPPSWQHGLRTALLAVGALGFLLVCVLVASGMRRNPTVLPGDPVVSALGALALVVVVGLLAVAATATRRRGDGSAGGE